MATWFRPTLAADERAAVLTDREEHPDPVVRRKMLVPWAVHLGHPRQPAADLAHVGVAAAKRYVRAYRDGGWDGLRRCDRHVPTSEPADHTDAIRRSLTVTPVRTAAEAADRIAELTGLRRGPTRTRTFLAALGFRWQRTRSVPVPPKRRGPSTSPPNTLRFPKFGGHEVNGVDSVQGVHRWLVRERRTRRSSSSRP